MCHAVPLYTIFPLIAMVWHQFDTILCMFVSGTVTVQMCHHIELCRNDTLVIP